MQPVDTMDTSEPPKEISWNDLAAFKRQKRRRKKEDLTEEEIILRAARDKQLFIAAERERIAYFRRFHKAALVIQKAWKMFKFKTKGILKNARDAVRRKRLDAGELEWKQQIAACTIQLAWRKYARRKLMARIQHTGSLTVHMWDSDMIGMKQRHVMQQIYSEQMYAPAWHPTLHTPTRPYWLCQVPSPAAISFNYAIDQYTQPLTYYSSSYVSEGGGRETRHTTNYLAELDRQIQEGLAELHVAHGERQPAHYSYNLT